MRVRPEITYEGIGVSLPGRVDAASSRLVFAPNLPWRDVDLKTPLEQATGLPVELENAANACALAEVWFGKYALGVQNLVAVTVSEGIGTGLILNHQLVRGSTGLAGEFGHTTLIEGGIECGCGNRGCWEVYASNSAAVRYYAENATASRPARTGSRSYQTAPNFQDVLRLAEQNDSKAVEAIEKLAYHLGAGIALLITGIAPDALVVIGEVTRVWNRIGPIIQETVRARAHSGATTQIFPTDPATQPRLRGTIALVLQKYFGAPTVA